MELNTIWELKGVGGSINHSFKELEVEGVSYFENILRAPNHNRIVEQLQILGNFSRIFE